MSDKGDICRPGGTRMDVEGLDAGIMNVCLKRLHAAIPYLCLRERIFSAEGFDAHGCAVTHEVDGLYGQVTDASFVHHSKQAAEPFTRHTDIDQIRGVCAGRLVWHDISRFVNDVEIGHACWQDNVCTYLVGAGKRERIEDNEGWQIRIKGGWPLFGSDYGCQRFETLLRDLFTDLLHLIEARFHLFVHLVNGTAANRIVRMTRHQQLPCLADDGRGFVNGLHE